MIKNRHAVVLNQAKHELNSREFVYIKRPGRLNVRVTTQVERLCVTGAFEEFGSVAMREFPYYLPRSFYTKSSSRNVVVISDLDLFS